jgi:hypothetical protein
MIRKKPQNAVLGSVGWTGTDLAQQVAHGLPLPLRVDSVENRSPVPPMGRASVPKNTVDIPIIRGFVRIGDTTASLHHFDRQIRLCVPRRNVGCDDAPFSRGILIR